MNTIDIRVLLPVISILSTGSLFSDILRNRILRIKKKQSLLEHLLESILVGSIALIAPMLILALIAEKTGFQKLLERFVYVYFAIGLVYVIFRFYLWIRKKLPSFVLSDKKRPAQSLELLLIVVIFLMFFFYILQGLVYPLRGWDFLHFYLPNSFRIYITGELGKLNELNFFPQFKPPANILLYAFTFFVTQSEMLHLVPFIFLGGTIYLCYKIAINEKLKRKNSLFSAIALLATPFTFFLVYEFQYYQEVYIMFFATASYYFYRSFLKSEETKEKIYLTLLTSLSLTGCVLSKISGFIIPLVIFVAMPSDKIGKILRVIVVLGITFQTIRKSIFEIYIGTGIFIFLLCIYCIYLIISSQTLTFSYSRWLYVLGIFSLPVLTAILWGLYLLTIPGVKDFLFDIYLNLPTTTLQLKWSGIAIPQAETYLENAHAATFFSSSFSLFIATMFAGTWLVFKIIGVVKATKHNQELLLWLLFFFIVWQGFFAGGSIRYLSPILVPLSIIFILGLVTALDKLNQLDNRERDGFLGTMFLIASAYLFLYPIIPFETLNEDFHLRLYYAHTRVGSILGYIALFTVFTFLMFWFEPKLKIGYSGIYSLKKFNLRKIVSGFLLFILIFVPFMAQAALLVYVNFDIDRFQAEYCYDTRLAYQELIEAINRLGYSDDLGVLSINTPGLEYYSSQPVLDLFMLGFIQNTALANSTFPLKIENVTRTLEFFDEYNLAIFVSLNKTHVWYPAFLQRYYWDFFFYRFIHNDLYFKWRFSNSEFLLYTIESYDPYVGPVDIQLSNGTHRGSLLARNPNNISLTGDLSVEGLLDLTSVPTEDLINVNITTSFSLMNNETIFFNSIEQDYSKSDTEVFTRLDFFEPLQSSFRIHSIEILMTFLNFENIVEERKYTLLPLTGTSVNITNNANIWQYAGYSGFSFH